MRNLKSIIAVSLILFLASCAKYSGKLNHKSIPEPVRKSFAAEFPDTEDIEWEKEGEHYEAEYEEKGVEKTVILDANGKIIATTTEISVDDLPRAIVDYVNNNYSGHAIDEAERGENEEGSFFEVEIEKDDLEIELMFDKEGNFMSEAIENEDEDEDDDEEEGDDD